MSMTQENYIVLRSVYGKVGMKYYIQPCKDPKTNRYPDCKVIAEGYKSKMKYTPVSYR